MRLVLKGRTTPAVSAGTAFKLNKRQIRAANRAVRRYLEAASSKTLLSGRTPRDFKSLFTGDIRNIAAGKDRRILSDSGLPKPTTDTRVTAQVSLRALAGPDGNLVFVAATIDERIRYTASRGGVAIHRFGELLLIKVKGSRFGIAGYDIDLNRWLPGTPPTTTSAKATTTT